MRRLFFLLLFAPTLATAQVHVEVRNSEVWLVQNGSGQQITHDGKPKGEAVLSAAQDRIAYYEDCGRDENCAASVVVLELSGARLASFVPKSMGDPCASILSIQWVGEGAVGVECHINPSLSNYVETDIETGKTVRDLLGYDFTPSPDGKWIAHVGWIPHFSPPPAHSNYLQIDNTTIYPLPPGSGTVEQKGLDLPPKVFRTIGLTTKGIHEFISEISWSPDSRRIALVDCTYDWTASSPEATSEGEGIDSGRTCSLVMVDRSGKDIALPLAEGPADGFRDSRISWNGARQVTLRVGGTTKTLTAPW
jgi:hypothetical protein